MAGKDGGAERKIRGLQGENKDEGSSKIKVGQLEKNSGKNILEL